MTVRQELLSNLTESQIAALRSCENVQDILTLARIEQVELTDEQLAAVAGGGCSDDDEDKKDKDNDGHRRIDA